MTIASSAVCVPVHAAAPKVRKCDDVWLATTTSIAAHSVSRASPTIASAAAACTASRTTGTLRVLHGTQQVRLKAAPKAANAISQGPA